VIIRADARAIPLIDACVDCVITSPPYFGLRDYGTASWVGGEDDCDHAHTVARHDGGRVNVSGFHGSAALDSNKGAMQFRGACGKCGAERVDAQIGLEPSPADYVASLVAVFAEVWRVLKPEGTCWLNLGDSYVSNGRYESDRSTYVGDLSKYDHRDPRVGARAIGVKPKDLLMIPARVALALQADGWYLRSDIIWSKPNPMPESVTDRPTKAHEYLFLLSKQERYYYDAQAIAEPVSAAMLQQIDEGYDGLGLKDYDSAGVQNPSSVKARIIANARKHIDNPKKSRGTMATTAANGYRNGDEYAAARLADGLPITRNKRTVWTVNTMPYAGAHFATMPEKLVEPCILAGCPMGGLVYDPFCGSGTVLAVAARLGRRGVGTDLSYQDLAKERTAQRGIPFGGA
jgi:DNA modification methylase